MLRMKKRGWDFVIGMPQVGGLSKPEPYFAVKWEDIGLSVVTFLAPGFSP